jgi:hypothetical protein
VGPYFVCNELGYELLNAVSYRLTVASLVTYLTSYLKLPVKANLMFIDAPGFIQFFPAPGVENPGLVESLSRPLLDLGLSFFLEKALWE